MTRDTTGGVLNVPRTRPECDATRLVMYASDVRNVTGVCVGNNCSLHRTRRMFELDVTGGCGCLMRLPRGACDATVVRAGVCIRDATRAHLGCDYYAYICEPNTTRFCWR